MKKYFQVTFILTMFFFLVLMTRMKVIQPFAQPANLDSISTILVPTPTAQPATLPATTPTPIATVATVPTVPTRTSGDSPTPTATPTSTPNSGYIDGVYTHKPRELHGGILQLQVTFVNGRMEDITFLQWPHATNTSRVINEKVLPRLRAKALETQKDRIDFISGASTTCNVFDYVLRGIVRRASFNA